MLWLARVRRSLGNRYQFLCKWFNGLCFCHGCCDPLSFKQSTNEIFVQRFSVRRRSSKFPFYHHFFSELIVFLNCNTVTKTVISFFLFLLMCRKFKRLFKVVKGSLRWFMFYLLRFLLVMWKQNKKDNICENIFIMNDKKVALVCASNQNRSVEAHALLIAKGCKNVYSYGTSISCKLPGPSIDKPNVYTFGTPYKQIYEELKAQNPELYVLWCCVAKLFCLLFVIYVVRKQMCLL